MPDVSRNQTSNTTQISDGDFKKGGYLLPEPTRGARRRLSFMALDPLKSTGRHGYFLNLTGRHGP